jgi:hypothetical protein
MGAHGLKVFETQLLRKIFTAYLRKKEVTGE